MLDILQRPELENIDKFEVLILKNELCEISLENFDEFIRFLKFNEVKSIFYRYAYNEDDIDEYLITEEILREIDLDKQELIIDDVKEYNSTIESINFDLPYAMQLFFILDKVVYSYIETNNEVDLIESPKNILNDILEDHKEEFEDLMEKNKSKLIKLKEELKNVILEDNNFRFCSNQRLRASYARELMESNEFKNKYKACFRDAKGYFRHYEVGEFVELIWKEFKMLSKIN